MMKKCKRCLVKKDVTEFHKCITNRDGHQAMCKECDRIRNREYYRNPEKHERIKANARRWYNEKGESSDKRKRESKNRRLKKSYGISIETYEEMLKEQNYSCAICKTNQSHFKTGLCVDHNHSTGRVRRLLCYRCNRLFVSIHTIDSAKAVYDYLLEHDKKDDKETA